MRISALCASIFRSTLWTLHFLFRACAHIDRVQQLQEEKKVEEEEEEDRWKAVRTVLRA